MKKVLCLMLMLALLLTQLPLAEAANSKSNKDIPKTVIEEDPPEDPDPGDDPGDEPVIEIVDDTPETEDLIEDMQTTYRLTVYYIYQDGTTAAKTYTAVLDTGTAYNVPSPEIDGYTPSVSAVSGIMPKRDIVYTVVYLRQGSGDSSRKIDDYETPLGIGFSNMNLGVCVD